MVKRLINRIKGIFIHNKKLDYTLLMLIMVITVFGVIMVYSASYYTAYMEGKSETTYFTKQLLFGLIGFVLMIVISKVDYHIYKKHYFYLLIFGVSFFASLWATLMGVVGGGASRWISIAGITVQPSELMKIALIVLAATFCQYNSQKIRNNKFLFFYMLITCLSIVPIASEGLTSALICVVIFLTVNFVASPRFLAFLGIGAVGIISGILFILSKGYRMGRFETWANPETAENGAQVMHSLYAIASGGLFGKGLGQGVEKMNFLAEVHTDMIFAHICEEMGLVTAIAIILLYMAILWRMFLIFRRAPDIMGGLLVVGVMAHIAIQAILNIAVATNSIPNTGVSLPFISYGGSSLMGLFIEMGLVLSVSRLQRQEAL